MPDELQTILDEAIKSYSAVEPSADLAGRILSLAQQQAPSPRRGWKLALAFALPVAAALALAFVLLGQWTLPKRPTVVATVPPTPRVAIQAHERPTEMLAAAKREPVPTHRKVRKAASRRSENRKSWARPLPAPYSKEELALLNFVQQHPKEAAGIAEAQKQDSAPLRPRPIAISQLKIKPLNVAALN